MTKLHLNCALDLIAFLRIFINAVLLGHDRIAKLRANLMGLLSLRILGCECLRMTFAENLENFRKIIRKIRNSFATFATFAGFSQVFASFRRAFLKFSTCWKIWRKSGECPRMASFAYIRENIRNPFAWFAITFASSAICSHLTQEVRNLSAAFAAFAKKIVRFFGRNNCECFRNQNNSCEFLRKTLRKIPTCFLPVFRHLRLLRLNCE